MRKFYDSEYVGGYSSDFKPYFAKYLSVEEEIKEQDLASYKDNIVRVDEFTHDDTVAIFNLDGSENQYNEVKEDVFKELAKKVKLFLCSRDIQVGDELDCVYTLPDGGDFHKKGEVVLNGNGIDNIAYTIKTKDAFYPSGFGKEFIPKEYAYKVIGEISPEAIFVKENDEFAEEQINKQWYDDSGSDDQPWKDFKGYDKYMTWEELQKENTKLRIQIKCSNCGHFH